MAVNTSLNYEQFDVRACLVVQQHKIFTSGHVRFWRLPLFAFKNFKIILPVFPQISGKNTAKKIQCLSLISSFIDFPFGWLGMPDHNVWCTISEKQLGLLQKQISPKKCVYICNLSSR